MGTDYYLTDSLRAIVVDTDELQMILDGLRDTINLCDDHGFSHDDASALYQKLRAVL